MLESFRKLAGSIWAKLLLAFLILTFAVWGIGDILRHPLSSVEVANVGNLAITHDEYAHALRQETEGLQRMLGDNYSPELLEKLGVRQQVLQKLINNKLLMLESEALGLVPSDNDVARSIRDNPTYQDSKGNFDKALFQAYLNNNHLSEKTYADLLRQDMANNLLLDTVSSATPVTDYAVTQLYQAREEQRNADLYLLDPTLISALPMPDTLQIETYYKQHTASFNSPEYRTTSYVAINNDSLSNLAPVDEETLRKAYQEHKDEFKKPEERNVEQLLFSTEDKARVAYAALQAGTSFEQIAKQSDILNKNVLSLGNIERDKAIDGTGDTIFSAPAGGVTAPIKSGFGWHIFHIVAIKEASVASFDEMRPTLEKELRQHDDEDALYKLATKLEDALAGGSSLTEAAKELGLKVVSLPPIDAQGNTNAGTPPRELPSDNKFLDTSFKTDEKTESTLIAARNGGYYIVRVENIIPTRTRSLAEVQNQVIASWQNEERQKHLSELATAIARRFSDAASRGAAISQYHLQAISSGDLKRGTRMAGTISLPPALLADIFAHKPGDATAAYQQLPVQQGNLKKEGYMLAVVKKIIPVTDFGNSAALASLRKETENNMQNELAEQYIQYLRNKYPLKINEAAFQENP